MPRVRRRFDAKFKSRVALEAIRGLKAISEIAKQFKVHPNQVTLWKKQLPEGAEGVFDGGVSSGKKSDDEPESAELYEQIGRMKVELEWLKKKLPRTRETALQWIDFNHETLSVRHQCQLLGIHRSQLYYEPVPETEKNLHPNNGVIHNILTERSETNTLCFVGRPLDRRATIIGEWHLRFAIAPAIACEG